MVAFTAGAVLTAANLNTAFNALTIRTVTGVSDTLVLADNGGAVSYSNASATTSTIPPATPARSSAPSRHAVRCISSIAMASSSVAQAR